MAKMITIKNNTLGVSNRLGLVNQIIEFFTHVKYAADNDIKYINLSSINWVLSWKNKHTLPHNYLFNVVYWNKNASKYNFPLLVKKTPIHECMNVNLPWNHKDFLDPVDKDSENFSKLLKPSHFIKKIINQHKPKDYAAIHFRIEQDLKIVPGWYEKRNDIDVLYQQIRNKFTTIPSAVYGCVCLNDVIDEKALKYFNKNQSPFKNVPLILGGSKICEKHNLNATHHHLIGAIIDYYIAQDAEHFFIGHIQMSTFSRSISFNRLRNNKKSYYGELELKEFEGAKVE